MTIEGRLGRIGSFTIPHTKEGLEEICGQPIQVGKGWTVRVAGVNGTRIPLSKIAVKPPRGREREYPVRIRAQKAIEINLNRRTTLDLKVILNEE